mgnify:CR=1 FL=1
MRRSANYAPKGANTVLKRWHRRVGMAAALFVLLLAFSGFILNHPELLALDRVPVRSPLVLGWYGIELPKDIEGFAVGEHWIAQVGGRLFRDATPLATCRGDLVGAVPSGEGMAVACTGELLLFTPAGELLDRFDAGQGLPVPVTALGTRDGGLLLRGRAQVYQVDPEGPVFTVSAGAEPAWAAPVALPQALVQELAPAAAGDAITLERVVLDLHSGRILGRWGVYWMDGVAALMVVLALTGLIAARREPR